MAAPATVVLMPFSYLDTSGEPRDQATEHDARLALMADVLRSGLEGTGSYRVASVPPQIAACAAKDSDCILAGARDAGAALVLTGAVQKVSTMATQLWIGLFDAADGRRLFYRQLTFRGDTDQAWQRSAQFLVHEIGDGAAGGGTAKKQ